jgi:hypothetical protein
MLPRRIGWLRPSGSSGSAQYRFSWAGVSMLFRNMAGDFILFLRHSGLPPILVRPVAICRCWVENPQAEACATDRELLVAPESFAW